MRQEGARVPIHPQEHTPGDLTSSHRAPLLEASPPPSSGAHRLGTRLQLMAFGGYLPKTGSVGQGWLLCIGAPNRYSTTCWMDCPFSVELPSVFAFLSKINELHIPGLCHVSSICVPVLLPTLIPAILISTTLRSIPK